ncbi:MAG: hypothetical protein IJQ83_00745 [Bacteroidales bacterium]|nr:hypothetical protein [Bacteroidales bacterium]
MRRNIIILAFIALIFSGCRKEADYHPYIGENGALAYDNYSTQFEYLWKCLSTGYVFWDVDKTDWDAVYNEYMPKFAALDAKHKAGQVVRTSELQELYVGAMGGMKDHHMNIVVKNLFPPADEQKPIVIVSPGDLEIEKRDYYVEDREHSLMRFSEMLLSMNQVYEIESPEMVSYQDASGQKYTYYFCLIKLPDGRMIPYLWQSSVNMTNTLSALGTTGPAGTAAAIIDHWFTAIKTMPREQLAGIILDNRCNTGGLNVDFKYVVGSFINTPIEVYKTRYKEGPNRLEHSVWTPMVINPLNTYHRDLTAENIPYVVLVDMYSTSMGEMEPIAIKKALPTSYIIGERTFGALGSLMASYIDITYGGPFGNLNSMYHYVYTSTFESLMNGEVLEGIGFTPDKVVNRKDHNGDFKPQLDAAIEYIKSVH